MKMITSAGYYRRRYIFLFIALATLLTGCWDLREIDQRAIIMSLGVDKAEDGPGYSVTFEIPNPLEFDVQAGDSSSADEGGRNIKAVGETLKVAIHNLALRVARQAFFGHLQIIIISEEVATEGITSVVDALYRLQEIQRPARLAIVTGTAEDLIAAKPETDKTFGTYMTTFFEKGNRTRRVPDSQLWKVDAVLARQYESFVLPLMQAGDKQVGVIGVAVIKNGKMVGKLNPDETIGFMWVEGEVIEEVIAVEIESVRAPVTVRNAGSRAKITPRFVDGELRMHVEISTELFIIEFDSHKALDQDVLQTVERRVAERIRTLAQNSIDMAQELEADIFGWGRIVRAKFPHDWDPEAWPATFAAAATQIDVKAAIRGAGGSV